MIQHILPLLQLAAQRPQRTNQQKALLGVAIIVFGLMGFLVFNRLLGFRLPFFFLVLLPLIAWIIIDTDRASKYLMYYGAFPFFIAAAMLRLHPYIITGLLLFLTLALLFTKGGKGFLIILANIVIIYIFLFSPFAPALFTSGPIQDAVDNQIVIVKQSISDIGTGFTGIQEEFERQISLAAYDAEIGEIDETAERKLGVFLHRDPFTEKTSFFIPHQVDTFATLQVETFKVDTPIDVTIHCYEHKLSGADIPAKEIRPATTIELYNREEQDIECSYDSTTLGKGTHNLLMEAQFTFLTSAYRKMYFMEQEKLRSYRDIDPLEEFNIDETHTTTKNTPGPITLGMKFGASTERSLLSISNQLQFGPSLSLTVANVWPGELKSIDELTISTPPGISIEDIDGVTAIQCAGCGSQECTCTIPKLIMDDLLTQEPVRAGLRVFTIHTKISDPQALIGDADISIRNFKATARYTYTNKEQFSVQVKQSPLEGTPQ